MPTDPFAPKDDSYEWLDRYHELKSKSIEGRQLSTSEQTELKKLISEHPELGDKSLEESSQIGSHPNSPPSTKPPLREIDPNELGDMSPGRGLSKEEVNRRIQQQEIVDAAASLKKVAAPIRPIRKASELVDAEDTVLETTRQQDSPQLPKTQPPIQSSPLVDAASSLSQTSAAANRPSSPEAGNESSNGQVQPQQPPQAGQVSLDQLMRAILADKDARKGIGGAKVLSGMSEQSVRDFAEKAGITGEDKATNKSAKANDEYDVEADDDPLIKKLERLRKQAKKKNATLGQLIQEIEQEIQGHDEKEVSHAKTAYGLDEDSSNQHLATSILAGAYKRPVHIRQAAQLLEDQKQQSDFVKDTKEYELEKRRRGMQEEKEQGYDQTTADLSPMGGSGKNLTDFGRNVFAIGRKVRNKLRGPLGPPPDRENYTKLGRRIGGASKGTKAATSRSGSFFSKLSGLFGKGGGASGTGAVTSIAAGAGGGGGGGGAAVAAAAGGAEGAAIGAEAAGATALGPAAIALAFGTAVLEFGKAVYSFAKGQEEVVRKQAEFGAQQAVGIAELDAGRQLRAIKTAEETGESGQQLTGSLNEFEEALRPIESLLDNIGNTVASDLLDVMTGVLQAVKPMVEILTEIYTVLGGKAEKGQMEVPADFINRVENMQNQMGYPKWPGAAPAINAMPRGR